MRAIAFLTCMALALCSFQAHAKRHAKNEHLDATGGKLGNHQIVYITHTESKNPTRGTAVLVLQKSGKQEIAYGYYIEESAPKVGLITSEQVAKVHKKDDPSTFITTVEVTPDQYAATRKIINTAIEKPNLVDGPTIVFYNNICKILRACNMKIPYRSPYRAPNPAQWIGDIPAYSRDLVIKK